jgi:hypothetical protein
LIRPKLKKGRRKSTILHVECLYSCDTTTL